MNLSFGKKVSLFWDRVSVRLDWKCIGSVTFAFVLTRFIILVTTYMSVIQIPVLSGEGLWNYNPEKLIANGLIRWDAAWFIEIVKNGYQNFESTAFFPVYPLLIKVFSFITEDVYIASLWVSNLAFFIALFYLYKLAEQEFDDETAGRVVFYLACAPAAFFFSASYSESVLFLFMIACFYYSRNQKWFPAAIAGALASATKITGVILAVFMLFEALWQQGFGKKPIEKESKSLLEKIKIFLATLQKARKGIFACLFVPSGLFAYMVYLYITFGNPLAFLFAERHWGRAATPIWPITLVENLIKFHLQEGSTYFHLAFDTGMVIIFLPIVIAAFSKFRPSYGWFTLLTYLTSLASGTTLAARRFVLMLVPCYFLLALWGKKPWLDKVIIGLSLSMLTYQLILYSHWVFAG